ncbi:MAG: HAD family hydrolase [Deltaproteobacteria bacterium]|nr:HAD family hydrolase [Deltaproteobacteria bacterium]
MNLLVFDIDGTLTTTNEVDTRCFARAFLETFDIALDTSWHIYPHRTDSGIIRHSFCKHFGRTPTTIELDLFRERFLNLLDREWRAAPQNFRAIAGATRAFIRIAQQRDYALALATGGWRVSALFKLEKGNIPIVGLPAAFADDATEREEIARIAIDRAKFHYEQQFDRIILVGDSDCDVTTAARLGLGFVGITADANDAVLRTAGAQYVLRDYSDFATFMRAVEKAAGVKACRCPIFDS